MAAQRAARQARARLPVTLALCGGFALAGSSASGAQAPASRAAMRYERAIAVPASSGAQAVCAALDAAAMAHSGSAAHNDLRVFAHAPGQPEVEQPFALAESGPAAVETAVLRPEHVEASGSSLRFDLAMPARPFADLTLQLEAADFIATARVWGAAQPGDPRQALGTFPVFDMAGMGRELTLPLAESTARWLHVELQMRDRAGRPLPNVRAAMLGMVTVPPSRQRQTLFTTVETTAAVSTVPAATGGTRTVALLTAPAHLPIERVAVTLDPAFDGTFRRALTVMAWPRRPIREPEAAPTPAAGPVWVAVGQRSAVPPAPAEEVESIPAGELSRVRLPSGDPGLRPLDQRQMTADAVLGANLRDTATVEVAIDNGAEPALPVRSVSLQMRRRSVCFRAQPGMRYALRYGDPDLPPPDATATLRMDAPMAEATLGPELARPAFPETSGQRAYLAAHPDTPWAVAIALAATLGGTALHRVKRAGGMG